MRKIRESSEDEMMEGHVRLTAYLMAPQYLPSELEVLLGTSAQITTWGCY